MRVGEQAFDESRIETHWGYAAMKTCLDYGWMTLTDTGEWKPNAFVTRAEFAADLAASRASTRSIRWRVRRFSDVDLTAEDAPYLAWAADSGIVAGYDDGTFRPEKDPHTGADGRHAGAVLCTLRRHDAGKSGLRGRCENLRLGRRRRIGLRGTRPCAGRLAGPLPCRRAGSPARRSPRSSCGWQDNKNGLSRCVRDSPLSYSISMRCPSRSSSWRACRRSGRCRRDAPV